MFTALALACTAPVPKAAPAPPPAPVVGKGFAAAPVTTALQRRLIGYDTLNVTAVVFLDLAAQFPNPPQLDPDGLDWAKLKETLAAYKPAKDAVLFCQGQFDGSRPQREGMRVLDLALGGLGRECGFSRVMAGSRSHFPPFKWDAFTAPLAKPGDSADEPAVGTGPVRGYAVRTPLSRVFCGPGVAGVVDYLTLLDADDASWDTAAGEKAAAAALAELKLPAGAEVVVHFRYTGDDPRRTVDNRLQALARQIAGDAGLVNKSVTTRWQKSK